MKACPLTGQRVRAEEALSADSTIDLDDVVDLADTLFVRGLLTP